MFLKFFMPTGLIRKLIWLRAIPYFINLSKLCCQNFPISEVIPKGNSRWPTSLRKKDQRIAH